MPPPTPRTNTPLPIFHKKINKCQGRLFEALRYVILTKSYSGKTLGKLNDFFFEKVYKLFKLSYLILTNYRFLISRCKNFNFVWHCKVFTQKIDFSFLNKIQFLFLGGPPTSICHFFCGKKLPEMKNNNYIHHVPYLRNSNASDHDFSYTCVK